MTSNTQTLNYESLSQPVSEADIAMYKQSTGGAGLMKPWMVVLIGAFIGGFMGMAFLMPMMVAVSNGAARMFIALLWVGLVVGAIVGLRAAFKYYDREQAKRYRFAVQNGITFVRGRADPGYAGMIFDEGHSRELREGYVFADGTEMGNYRYVTGSGKNRSTHDWAYIKVKLPRRLPHMVLDAKKNNIFGKFSNLTDTFDGSQTLALEGDFNEHFTLYAPKQYERDALYVFTPDVMARLIDSGSGFDMEVIDDELYIYRASSFNLASEAELRTLLGIVSVIGRELKDQTDYYADERVGDRTQNIIATPGARLKHGVNWVAIGIVVIMILFYTFDLWVQLFTWITHD